MNKKFLSAILFGALALASTGSFVSCQDYDDEIDNLQSQINGLASAKDLADKVSQLQAEIAAAKEAATKEATEEAKKAIEKLDQLSKELEKTMDDLKKATEADMEALNKKVAAFQDEVNAAVAGFAKSLKSIVFQPELYIDGIEAAKYTYLRYAALTPGMDAYKATEKNDRGNSVKLAAKAADGYTVTQYYHDGNIIAGVNGPVELAPNSGHTYVGKEMQVGVVDSVKFFINPGNAEVTKEQAKMLAQNVVATTRAEEHDKNPEITVTDVKVVSDTLTVYYKVENIAALISANHGENNGVIGTNHKNTTMFHAEVTNSDNAVIASDLAMLYENAVQPVAIAWNKDGIAKAISTAKYCTEKTPELYKNPYEALEAKSSLALGYNDKGYDLYDLIELHMVSLDVDGVCAKDMFGFDEEAAVAHTTLTLAEAEAKYGLTVKFTPVDYDTEVTGSTAAGNKTKPSNYINPALGAKGHVVAGIVSDKDGSFDPEQGVSSVGKQPLVQVLVMKDKDVVLEGYIKLQITRTTESKKTPLIDLGKKKFACDGLDYAMTWYQASTIVLEKTMGMGKGEFDANYQLVKLNEDPEEKCAAQWIEPSDASKKVELKNMYALVYEGIDPESPTNTVLHVALDKYAQQYILEEMDGKADLYVKYAPKGSDDERQYEPGVFVCLHIEIDETPEILQMEKKIAEYWYKTGVGVNDSSTSEKSATDLNTLRLNVNKPDDEKNSYNSPAPFFMGAEVHGFVRDVRSAFEVHKGKNDVVLTKDGAPYASTYEEEAQERTMFYFHPAINGTTFKGDEGYEYILSVKYDYVICNKWVRGDGPKAIIGTAEENHRTADVLTHKIEKIGEKPLNFVETVIQDNKLDKAFGIFQNTKLYVKILDGKKVIAEDAVVAELDPMTGQIWYNHTDEAQKLLNATSWKEAKAKAYVGVYSVDNCDDVMAVKDGIFPAYFLRPLDINNAKPKEVTDATANGSIAKISDLATFIDWREEEITPAKNGWLLAYYGVNKITVNLEEMTTDMNGYEFSKKLVEVTKDAKFSLIDGGVVVADMDETNAIPSSYAKPAPSDLSAYDYASISSASVFDAVFGGLSIKYENNGLNVYNWTVKIPVTIGYDWGEFKTFVTVKVVKTLGTED